MAEADERARQEAGETGETGEAGAATSEQAGELPEIDFATFALSLSTSALLSLGLVPDPSTGERGAVDLPAARQTIEILRMLQVKTRGNLETEEVRLIESLLYELQMRYVEAQR